MATIERLYELYNIIADDSDKSKHENEYKEIMTGSKAGSAERRLSSQFLAKFFSEFPNLHEEAVNSQFDLCEDDDMSVRKQAIKDLPTFCKCKPDLIPKVADILAQLFQMEDPTEIAAIQSSLFSLLKMDAKGTLTGIFYQIENNMDEQVTERCLKFLHNKIRTLVSEVFTPECEELVMKECKSGLKREASEEEFVLIMSILKELKISKNLKGHQQLLDFVEEQCDFSRTLDVEDLESLNKLSSCLKQAMPYFSSQIRSTKFFDFVCKEVMPLIPQIDEQDCPSLVLDLLRTTAQMVSYTGVIEDVEEKLNATYSLLLDVMPLPPVGEAADTTEDGVSLEFSRVECLLYIFHQLGKSQAEFLSENQERLKDFRTRLQYFARGSQAYQKKLRETLSSKKGDELKTEENRIKLIALKTTANINVLIKDLFHTPPSYKSSITLSWKEGSTAAAGDKRHAPITFETSPSKFPKIERKIYAPPRDKFSRSAGQFVARGSGRGRGRGGSSFRRGAGRFRRF